MLTGGFSSPSAPGLLPAIGHISKEIGRTTIDFVVGGATTTVAATTATTVAIGSTGGGILTTLFPGILVANSTNKYHPFVNGYLNKRAEVGGTIADWTKKHYPQHNYQFNLLPPPSYQPPETNIVP